MSHEILLVAGSPAPVARMQRLNIIAHAAQRVPGMQTWSLIEGTSATAALVETSPAGGSFAALTRTEGGGRITLASTPAGLAAGESTSAEYGAEAGHVTALLAPDASVSLANDGVGFLPAYWAVHNETFYASTHLASIVSLGLPADVDEQGLIEYLTMLHPMRDRTILRAAKLLPPGASLRWEDSRVAVAQRPLFVPSSAALDDDDVIATFREIWPRVVHDALSGPGRSGIGLSGGLDSRAIAEAAVRLGHSPVAYTYGTAPSREAVVGAQVAEVLGLPHLGIPVSDNRLLADARASLERLDGSHSASEMYELWFADLLRSFTDVVVNGLAGGPLWGDDKAVGMIEPRTVRARQWSRYAAEARRIAPFVTGGLSTTAEDVIRHSLDDSLGMWDLEARSDMVVFWKIANRQIRWGNMLTNALRRVGIRTQAPFLDSRFLALAARLTADQRRNGRLYLRVQREVFPRTAGIARSDDGNRPRSLDHVYWSGESSFLRQLAALAVRHPVSGLRRGWRLGSHAGLVRLRSPLRRAADAEERRRSVFPADVWLRTRPTYAGRLVALLEPDRRSELLSAAAIESAVAGIRRRRPPVPALTLGKVAAASAWLEDYERRSAQFQRTAGDERWD